MQDAARAFQQYLESLQLAGVSHIPSSEVVAVAEVPVAAEPTSAATMTVALPPTPAPKEKPAEQTPVANTSLFAAPPSSGEPSDLPLDQRQEQLAQVAQAVSACTRCQQLASTRRQTVFGVGNPEAKIMFIGEAPGADEDRQGEPFVGRAGQLLNRIIGACKLARDDIYICNILRCRPPGNRNPTPEEATNCREYLDAQIRIVDPDYIVCWGSVAAQNLLDVTDSVGRMRGKFFKYGRAKVSCTYHPSYLLRNESAKKYVWDDMKWLFADMGVDLTG
ncbi:MAG: uracil-DNA glycosylase [Planctomycetaceae bacterium]|nr:uracil-DNA glycosylase [Planctomycetaceae bacterium]